MDIQEEGTLFVCSFSRMHIFDIWLSANTSNDNEKCRHVLETLLSSLNDAENINICNLVNIVNSICKSIVRLWKKCNRTKSRLLITYSDWLNVIERVELTRNQEQCIPTENQSSDHSRGRPRKPFSECSKRSQRRRVAELSKSDDSTVNALLDVSNSSDVSKVSTADVLSLITEAKLTKHQYLLVKDFVNTKIACNVLPCYQQITEAKKKCYPPNITVTESSAEVELQSLVDHTTSRILESQKEVLDQISNECLSNITLLGKWGFDGSTGHSEYKQSFADSSLDDSSMFVTSFVPLQIVATLTDGNCKILWKNPRPSSTRYCRPIRFQFLKENAAVSLEEEAYFKTKIQNLQPTIFRIDTREFVITHNLQLSMVDGKICSALSETSTSRCYICNATPKEMNKIDECLQKPVIESRYEFGLSPLHAWIRFFEYFIHLSYRLDIKKWQIRLDSDKQLLSNKKQHVQSQFRERLGLIVDKPRSGGSGTSNDGNTARKFFMNSGISAEITGLNKDLIDRCCVILQTLSSGYKINESMFKEYALQTAYNLVEEYPWYNLPASVHKVLVHGSDIISSALLSIGELSEEAAEATNKYIKIYRQSHTRKMSREITNQDLLQRLLLHSDPFITSLRKIPPRKKSMLSKSVLELLEV